MKKQGFDFRKVLKTKANGLIPQPCKSKSSPRCQETFILTREEQTMCHACLCFNDLLAAHPLLKMEE